MRNLHNSDYNSRYHPHPHDRDFLETIILPTGVYNTTYEIYWHRYGTVEQIVRGDWQRPQRLNQH